MVDLEVPVFVGSIVLTLKAWLTWYRDIVFVNRLQVQIQQRLVLLLAPLHAKSKSILLKLGFRRTVEVFYKPTGLMHPTYELRCAAD